MKPQDVLNAYKALDTFVNLANMSHTKKKRIYQHNLYHGGHFIFNHSTFGFYEFSEIHTFPLICLIRTSQTSHL